MKAGTVTALAREAPCGSAQASRTNCRLSLRILSLISSACRHWSSDHSPCRSMKDCPVIARLLQVHRLRVAHSVPEVKHANGAYFFIHGVDDPILSTTANAKGR